MLKVCALCGDLAELCSSHYIPAAFYKRADERSSSGKPPVLLTRTTATFKTTQPRHRLLCATCEHRFKTRGEDYVINNSAKPPLGFFHLRSYLLRTLPDSQIDSRGFIYLAAMLPKIDHKALTYFATSIFWRGHVVDWASYDPTTPIVALPDAVAHDFKNYLLDRGTFPKDLVLLVEVASQPFMGIVPPSKVIITSGGRSMGEEVGYSFSVFGITFWLLLDPSKAGVFSSCTSIATYPHPIVLADVRSNELFEAAKKLSATAQRKGKFRDVL